MYSRRDPDSSGDILQYLSPHLARTEELTWRNDFWREGSIVRGLFTAHNLVNRGSRYRYHHPRWICDKTNVEADWSTYLKLLKRPPLLEKTQSTSLGCHCLRNEEGSPLYPLYFHPRPMVRTQSPVRGHVNATLAGRGATVKGEPTTGNHTLNHTFHIRTYVRRPARARRRGNLDSVRTIVPVPRQARAGRPTGARGAGVYKTRHVRIMVVYARLGAKQARVSGQSRPGEPGEGQSIRSPWRSRYTPVWHARVRIRHVMVCTSHPRVRIHAMRGSSPYGRPMRRSIHAMRGSVHAMRGSIRHTMVRSSYARISTRHARDSTRRTTLRTSFREGPYTPCEGPYTPCEGPFAIRHTMVRSSYARISTRHARDSTRRTTLRTSFREGPYTPREDPCTPCDGHTTV